jgi:hypothetical protein
VRRVLGLAIVLCAVPFAADGVAQTAARPDLSGYWELRLDSFHVPRAALTPQSLKNVDAQAKNDADALGRCALIGMPALMDDRSPLDIRHAATVIAMVAKSPSSTRYIYVDGRMHPAADELEPTTNGHSIGRWEGETLVADTVGFNSRGITRIPGGGYRTPMAHLVERYRLLDGGRRLSVQFTWEDSAVFERPHSYEFEYYKVADIGEPRVVNCVPSPERTRFLTNGPVTR